MLLMPFAISAMAAATAIRGGGRGGSGAATGRGGKTSSNWLDTGALPEGSEDTNQHE